MNQWSKLAACRGQDPDVFFPQPGSSPLPAKRLCMTCVVRADCLDYALADPEIKGIWGGTSERERRRIRDQYIKGKDLVPRFFVV